MAISLLVGDYAKVNVHDGPSVYLFNLTRSSFDGPGGFCFFQVGSYAVRYVSRDGFSNSLCFRESGDVAKLGQLFPVRIRVVGELIQQVSTIEAVLAQWPRCPGYRELTGDGGDYHVCTNSDVSVQSWPKVKDK